jgi:hypothetical protein
MKAFLSRFSVFLSLLIVSTIGILMLPYDREFGYRSMFPGCGEQGRWIYNRIFINPKRIDVAFIGSSHTMGAVQDSLMNEISKQNGFNIETTNLGFCRTGRDIHYIFVRDLLQQKKIKLLVVEVTEKEEYYSHPDFPWIATMDDLIAPKSKNHEYWRIMGEGIAYRWEFVKRRLNHGFDKDKDVRNDFSYWGHIHVADTASLSAAKKAQEAAFDPSYKGAGNDYTLKWLIEIAKLAMSNKVPIVFLYQPSYGSPLKKPYEIGLYDKYGPTWQLPDSILINPKYWYDEGHLNREAADAVAPLLLDNIRSALKR